VDRAATLHPAASARPGLRAHRHGRADRIRGRPTRQVLRASARRGGGRGRALGREQQRRVRLGRGAKAGQGQKTEAGHRRRDGGLFWCSGAQYTLVYDGWQEVRLPLRLAILLSLLLRLG
jgi:hypothetical protein